MTKDKPNRKQKFFKDFGIYSIGVLGTRMITFLMVPLYTYFVEQPADYGVWDLCMQSCLFLLPLSTLQMREASFRFLLDSSDENLSQKVVTFVYKTLVGNLLLISILVCFASLFCDFRFIWYTLALLIVLSLHDVVCQISRGLKRNDIYVSCNLLNAFLVGLLSVIFVVPLHLGVEGIFLANILSRVLVIAFVELRLHVFATFFRISINTTDTGRQILRYALPMIPSNMFWLVTTVSDRFFIRYFISAEMNGIYAVTIRFTMILQTLALIFYQTWQETAITQYHTQDRDKFFSKVFNYYLYVLVFILIGYTYLLKINYGWLVGDNYQESAQYLYWAGVAFLLGAISSSFFELGYQCAKDTKRLIPSVMLAAIINIALNFVLTPIMGVYGVIITAIVSYLSLDIYRYFDTKRYFRLTLHSKLFVLLPILLIGGWLYECSNDKMLLSLELVALCGAMLILMPQEIKRMLLNKIGVQRI